MNTHPKISTLITGIFLLFCCSCRKYQVVSPTKDINEVNVGLQPAYTVYLGDTLHIVPTVSFTLDNSKDTGRYTYQWYRLPPELSGNFKLMLDSTRVLDYKVTLAPGDYVIYCNVTDTVTGIAFRSSTHVKVITPYYEGWLVLSDAASAPRLDMVSYDEDHVATTYFDLLGRLHSDLVLTGQARAVLFSETIYIATTGNGANTVDPEDFSWKPINNIRYSILDPNLPPDYYPDRFFLGGNQGGQVLWNSGDVYSRYGAYYNFGVPVNRFATEETNFYAAPFVGAGFYLYLYDTAKHRFAQNLFFGNRGSCKPMPAFGSSGATLFDWNNTGQNLVFMDECAYDGQAVFAILKDTAADKFHLAIINDYSQTQDYYAEMTGPNLAAATHFALNNNYGYVFYSSGSKLYEFDLGLRTSKLMADYGSLQISNLFRNPEASQTNDLLVTLTDPAGAAGSNGILKIYSVPPVGGSLVLHETYTGFGDIKGITYRRR